MESLIIKSDRLVKDTNINFVRYLYHNIEWSNRLIGIVGAKGTGKTTLLLQYIKQNFDEKSKFLYVSLDDIWFSTHTLSELAEQFYLLGGTHLFLDEVHKYKNWDIEIKNIYDSYRSLNIVFTGSSMLEIFEASVDFSRRIIVYELRGLSFREFLQYEYNISFKRYSLQEIIDNHRNIVFEIIDKIKIIPAFKKYLEHGYYPYYKESLSSYPFKIEQSINKTLKEDIPAIEDIEYATILKIKKMLGIIGELVPFTPNISQLSGSIEISRNALVKYLYLLDKAGILMCINEPVPSLETLSKPQKVYLDNTNIINSLSFENKNIGNERETFFANQLRAKHKVSSAKNGDFTIDEKIIFEVGGKNKGDSQIKGITNAYIAADNIENGFANKIPLWLFGFLY
jgi:predicted AAA+ superfamily ATPase